MVARNFAASLRLTLQFEGGYSDHPADPGGATKYGITQAVLAEWRGRQVSKQEVRDLARSEAEAIYRRSYWDAVGGDELPAGVDAATFDYAVNSGRSRAARVLQKIIGVTADGFVGVDTVARTRSWPAEVIVAHICAERRGFLGRLKIFPTFGRGWLRRVDAIEAFARDLARKGTTTPRSSQTEETRTMLLTKNIIQSRTVWANVIGLAAFGASMLGLNISGLDQPALVDAVLQAVTGAGFIASTIFRVKATKLIS